MRVPKIWHVIREVFDAFSESVAPSLEVDQGFLCPIEETGERPLHVIQRPTALHNRIAAPFVDLLHPLLTSRYGLIPSQTVEPEFVARDSSRAQHSNGPLDGISLSDLIVGEPPRNERQLLPQFHDPWPQRPRLKTAIRIHGSKASGQCLFDDEFLMRARQRGEIVVSNDTSRTHVRVQGVAPTLSPKKSKSANPSRSTPRGKKPS